jgi:hypothetical protein
MSKNETHNFFFSPKRSWFSSFFSRSGDSKNSKEKERQQGFRVRGSNEEILNSLVTCLNAVHLNFKTETKSNGNKTVICVDPHLSLKFNIELHRTGVEQTVFLNFVWFGGDQREYSRLCATIEEWWHSNVD